MKTTTRLQVLFTPLLISLLSAIALIGCDVIDYHPYDTKLKGNTEINKKAIENIERHCAGKEVIRFAVLTDTQRWYDETCDAVSSINKQPDIDFVIHCGDLTDFGATKEFEWMHRELKRLHPPYVAIIGNHDCLGTGEDVFKKMYGATNFSFNVGAYHIVCLNTNAVEYDYSVAIPDFSYIRTDRENIPDSIFHTIVTMHAPPFSEQFNNNVAEVFHKQISLYPNLLFCLHGHTHHMNESKLFEDNIVYYECASAKERAYRIFTLKKDCYSYEIIHF